MPILISDASVLIDIEIANLTQNLFTLPYQFLVPDILFEEELKIRHANLIEFGLIIKTKSGNQILEAYNLRQQYIKLSVNDLLALILAKSENCALLTGDRAYEALPGK